jgi:hypothetical protein
VPGDSIVLTTSEPAPDAGTVAAGFLTGSAAAGDEGAAADPEFSIDFGIVADGTASVQNIALRSRRRSPSWTTSNSTPATFWQPSVSHFSPRSVRTSRTR